MMEETKVQRYYDGLKDIIKDKLSKIDKPIKFLDYTSLAIRIENCLYERHLENKEKSIPKYSANTSRKQQPRTTSSGTQLGPMELDAAQKRDFTCYNCGNHGHPTTKTAKEIVN